MVESWQCTDGAIGERLELCNNWLVRFANSPRDRTTEDAMADSTTARRCYISLDSLLAMKIKKNGLSCGTLTVFLF